MINIIDNAPIGEGVGFRSNALGSTIEYNILSNDMMGADGAAVTKFELAILDVNYEEGSA